jgi:mono/diheme cytochrome c family protein
MIDKVLSISILVLTGFFTASCCNGDKYPESKLGIDTSEKQNAILTETKPQVVVIDSFGIGKRIFDENCIACHRVGGRLIGPDLAGISKIKSHKWQLAFIRQPDKFFKTDPYVIESVKQSNGALMTGFNISNDSAEILFKFIDNSSMSVY